MKIYSEITDENKLLSLALGVFDGVHKGHVEVIKSAVNFAQKSNKKSAIITFKTHPQTSLNPNFSGCITTVENRIKIFETLGVDYCYLIDFDKIKNLTGEEYLQNILIKNFAPVAISTGFNHHFGVKKSGSTEMLEYYANQYGYKYNKIQPVVIGDETVSSSLIRKYLTSGNIEKTELYTDRKFSVSGEVVKGAGLARKIGFKTANINWPDELLTLPFGAYSVNAKVKGKAYSAIANFGIKPTIDNLVKKPVLEVHLLNFNKDLYGQELNVEFLKFIRAEKKFNSLDELKNQIAQDIMLIKQFSASYTLLSQAVRGFAV